MASLPGGHGTFFSLVYIVVSITKGGVIMLNTRCILAPRRGDDGLRISVMNRHTLTDGVTPDRRIAPASFDAWWPELAPASALLGAYYKQGLPWKEFEERFRNHLLSHQRDSLEELVRISWDSPVTILCIEATLRRCHRRLVAEVCLKIDPRLRVSIA